MVIKAKREQGTKKREVHKNGLKTSFGEIHERKVDWHDPQVMEIN